MVIYIDENGGSHYSLPQIWNGTTPVSWDYLSSLGWTQRDEPSATDSNYGIGSLSNRPENPGKEGYVYIAADTNKQYWFVNGKWSEGIDATGIGAGVNVDNITLRHDEKGNFIHVGEVPAGNVVGLSQSLESKITMPGSGSEGQVLSLAAGGSVEWKTAPASGVSSVNGMSGEVTVDIPTKVSDLSDGKDYALSKDLDSHVGNTLKHVTAEEKSTWSAKQDKFDEVHKLSHTLVDGLVNANNATVTVNQGGVLKGSFTLNQSEPVVIDLDAGGTGAVSDVHGVAVEVLRELPSWSESDDGRVFQWHGTGDPSLVSGNIYRVEKKTKTVSTPNPNEIIVSGMNSNFDPGFEFDGTYVNDGNGIYEKSGGYFIEYNRSGWTNKYFIAEPNDEFNLISFKDCPGGSKNPIDIIHLQNSGGFKSVWGNSSEFSATFSNTTTTETVTTYEPVLFNPASSGGASGTQVSHLQLVKPAGSLHLQVKVAGSDGSLASSTLLVDTAQSTGLDKLMAYSDTGASGVWDKVTAEGLPHPYDGNPVSIDMTGVAVPSNVYYCWSSPEGVAGLWHSTVFPMSGESSSHDSGIDQILAGKMDKPSIDGTVGQVLKSNGDGTASWSDAGSVDLSAHAENHDIHVTAEDKVKWNAKQDAITDSSKLQASLIDGLAAVATTGSYNSLSERPEIPVAPSDSRITIRQGGTEKGSFTLNQSEAVTIDLDAGGASGNMPDASGSRVILSQSNYEAASKTVTLPGISTPVVGLIAPSGNYHAIEKDDCVVSGGITKVLLSRYLQYENAASFSDGWIAYVFASEAPSDYVSGSVSGMRIWAGTQEEFRAIAKKDPNTLYVVHGVSKKA